MEMQESGSGQGRFRDPGCSPERDGPQKEGGASGSPPAIPRDGGNPPAQTGVTEPSDADDAP